MLIVSLLFVLLLLILLLLLLLFVFTKLFTLLDEFVFLLSFDEEKAKLLLLVFKGVVVVVCELTDIVVLLFNFTVGVVTCASFLLTTLGSLLLSRERLLL